MFHSSWQATTHTWVNTLRCSSCPVRSRSLFVTGEDHWLLQGPFVCLHSPFGSLSGSQGSAPNAAQSHFTSTVRWDTRGTPRQKGPPKIPPNPPRAEQAGLTAVCALPQEADIAQPLRSGLEASFTTRTLIVSALVMSACSAANSFLPLSPNSPSHSVCQSCQQINPWLPTTHSSLSQQQAQTRTAKSGIQAINVTPD